MAREPQFDQHQVLQRAMEQFWRFGYSGTSVQDLVAATGINRASMYGAFGDKRSLFLGCLDQYIEEISARRQSLLSCAGPAPAVIRGYFDDLLATSLQDRQHLGCLLTNSALEIAPHDEEVNRRLKRRLLDLEQTFQSLIQRGQSEGDIPADRDPRQIARFLVSSIQGIRVMARLGPKPQMLKDIVRVAMQSLAD